ncbi:MAG: putative photosynthetic complex assembly protein PuhE [Gammaproteobacteria bacterium]
MNEVLVALGAAIGGWWISTGVVLYLNQLPARSHPWSLGVATLVLLASLAGLHAGRDDTSTAGALAAFAQAILVWAWVEMSYFMGLVTGPRTEPCPPEVSGWQRFRLALDTSIHHELLVVAMAALVAAITWPASNPVGTWTFTALWLMRWSAKLNLFLGVPNVNLEWFPRRMDYLGTYIARRPMNLLFPVSICLGTVAATMCALDAHLAEDAWQQVAFALLATLLALGTLEHWFMVLPLRDSALWRWALNAAASRK